MGLKNVVDFDNIANFTTDVSKIEIPVDNAQLKIGFTSIADFSEDFASDAGHVYDPNLAEFVAGALQKKDTTPANSIIGANFATNINANWRKDAGSLLAALVGSPTLTAGEVVCTGSQGFYYDYTTSAIETHKFEYRPNYTTTPPANINVVSTGNGVNNNDRFLISNSPSGNNLRYTLNDNTGATVISIATSIIGWNPTAGQKYEIEVVLDSVAGKIYLLIDGVLLNTKTVAPWDRGGIASRAWLGAFSPTYNRSEGDFDNYLVFTDAQHTGSYTPGYSVPNTLYSESKITMPLLPSPGIGDIRASAAMVTTETGAPRYIVSGLYWDGLAWEVSNGSYAQASSKADYVANFGSFPTTGVAGLIEEIVFDASNTQSTVSQYDMAAEAEYYDMTNPTIRPNGFTHSDGLEGLINTEFTEPGSDAVRQLVERRTTPGAPSEFMRWDGAAWVATTEDYANANTLSDIHDNAAALDLLAGYYVRLATFLHSEDGLTTPTITTYTLCYSFTTDEPEPRKCILWGWLRKSSDEEIVGAVKIITKTAFTHTGVIVPKSEVRVVAKANGYWEIALYETATVAETYTVEIRDEEPADKVTTYVITLPDQDSENLANLV